MGSIGRTLGATETGSRPRSFRRPSQPAAANRPVPRRPSSAPPKPAPMQAAALTAGQRTAVLAGCPISGGARSAARSSRWRPPSPACPRRRCRIRFVGLRGRRPRLRGRAVLHPEDPRGPRPREARRRATRRGPGRNGRLRQPGPTPQPLAGPGRPGPPPPSPVADGAVQAYRQVTGQDWKPYVAAIDNTQTVDRRSAVAEISAFGRALRRGPLGSRFPLRPSPPIRAPSAPSRGRPRPAAAGRSGTGS